MRRGDAIALVLAPVFLAGCQRGPSPAASRMLPADTGASIEWQGRRACADCAGIATRLVLQQGDDRKDYELTETYFTRGGDTRFSEHGRWQ